MLQWLFYVLVVTTLLGSAAWLLEHALRGRHWHTRWVWVTAMGLTVLFAYLSVTPPFSPAMPSKSLESWRTIQHIAPLRLPQLISANATATAYRGAAKLGDAAIVKGWLALSALLMLMLAVSGVHVFWRRRSWPLRLVCSVCVSLAPDTGPAVVGFLRPTIVMPLWVLERSPSEQQLILAHEQSHLQARDPLLLMGALAALIVMPWNLPLWWLLHRLRHAIEVDCDTRVLRQGHDIQAYGQVLIEVGQRRGAFVGAMAAMSESRTLLEKRIEIMTQHSRKPWTYGFAACCSLAAAIAAGATQITAPDATAMPQQPSVDVATLENYVGRYQLGPSPYWILTVRLDGTQLNAWMGTIGEPPVGEPFHLHAQTPTKFFYRTPRIQPWRNVTITFAVGENGVATTATVEDNGSIRVAPRLDATAAEALVQQLATRVSQQSPQIGSAAALRKALVTAQSGALEVDDWAPAFHNFLPQILSEFRGEQPTSGTLQAVVFKGVLDSGDDKYVVTYQDGAQEQCAIVLDANGKIGQLICQSRF